MPEATSLLLGQAMMRSIRWWFVGDVIIKIFLLFLCYLFYRDADHAIWKMSKSEYLVMAIACLCIGALIGKLLKKSPDGERKLASFTRVAVTGLVVLGVASACVPSVEGAICPFFIFISGVLMLWDPPHIWTSHQLPLEVSIPEKESNESIHAARQSLTRLLGAWILPFIGGGGFFAYLIVWGHGALGLLKWKWILIASFACSTSCYLLTRLSSVITGSAGIRHKLKLIIDYGVPIVTIVFLFLWRPDIGFLVLSGMLGIRFSVNTDT